MNQAGGWHALATGNTPGRDQSTADWAREPSGSYHTARQRPPHTEASEGLDRHYTFDNLIEGSLPSAISYC